MKIFLIILFITIIGCNSIKSDLYQNPKYRIDDKGKNTETIKKTKDSKEESKRVVSEEKIKKEFYNEFGYDKDGYDRDGFDQYGQDREGYDRKGFKNGYNRAGFDKKGYYSYHYDVDGITKNDLKRVYEKNDNKKNIKYFIPAYNDPKESPYFYIVKRDNRFYLRMRVAYDGYDSWILVNKMIIMGSGIKKTINITPRNISRSIWDHGAVKEVIDLEIEDDIFKYERLAKERILKVRLIGSKGYDEMVIDKNHRFVMSNMIKNYKRLINKN